jgi:hypothetical protein
MPHKSKYPELSQLSPKSKDAAYKRMWREEMNSDPTKKETYRQKQNEYKRRSRAKIKLQQATVEPPKKRRRVATPDPGPSDFHTPAPNSPTAINDLPHHSKDLATGILGVQVSSFSDTVQWSSGFTTVLPCIWKGEKNLCQADADTVRYFSQLPESDPELSTHIVHVHQRDWSPKQKELRDLVAETLREGKCIVIRALQEHQPEKLDVDYLEALGFSQCMRVSIHGQSFFYIPLISVDLTQ